VGAGVVGALTAAGGPKMDRHAVQVLAARLAEALLRRTTEALLKVGGDIRCFAGSRAAVGFQQAAAGLLALAARTAPWLSPDGLARRQARVCPSSWAAHGTATDRSNPGSESAADAPFGDCSQAATERLEAAGAADEAARLVASYPKVLQRPDGPAAIDLRCAGSADAGGAVTKDAAAAALAAGVTAFGSGSHPGTPRANSAAAVPRPAAGADSPPELVIGMSPFSPIAAAAASSHGRSVWLLLPGLLGRLEGDAAQVPEAQKKPHWRLRHFTCSSNDLLVASEGML